MVFETPVDSATSCPARDVPIQITRSRVCHPTFLRTSFKYFRGHSLVRPAAVADLLFPLWRLSFLSFWASRWLDRTGATDTITRTRRASRPQGRRNRSSHWVRCSKSAEQREQESFHASHHVVNHYRCILPIRNRTARFRVCQATIQRTLSFEFPATTTRISHLPTLKSWQHQTHSKLLALSCSWQLSAPSFERILLKVSGIF